MAMTRPGGQPFGTMKTRPTTSERTMNLPVPELEPRAITLEEYFELTPEKLELLSGYLIDGPDEIESRRRLLSLLLVNTGLTETVRLAPRLMWVHALERAYGMG
jgi:hypothetical protein